MIKRCGGFRLFNLKLKDQSLKFQWITTFFSNYKIYVLAKTSFKKVVRDVSDFLWKANIRKDDLKLYLKLGFWFDVMLAWASYNYEYPNNKTKILKQIWANLIYVNIEGKPFVNTRAIHAGFFVIKEIINDNSEFYNYTTILI